VSGARMNCGKGAYPEEYLTGADGRATCQVHRETPMPLQVSATVSSPERNIFGTEQVLGLEREIILNLLE
jgi:hypothetical protein